MQINRDELITEIKRVCDSSGITDKSKILLIQYYISKYQKECNDISVCEEATNG